MTYRPHRIHWRHAFTVLEALVVIAITGLLIGLSLQAIQAVRGSAARLSCQSNLRQIVLASHLYEQTHGYLPPDMMPVYNEQGKLRTGYTWGLLLTPYLEQRPLWDRAVADYFVGPSYAPPRHPGLSTTLKVYTCAADSRVASPITTDLGFPVAFASYVAIVGDYPLLMDSRESPRYGAIHAEGKRGVALSQITDGLSQTAMFGESPPAARWFSGSWYTSDVTSDLANKFLPCRHSTFVWARARYVNFCKGPFFFSPGRVDNLCDSFKLWSLHNGGANFAFGDGSVRFLSYSAADLIPALSTRAGGETVEFP